MAKPVVLYLAIEYVVFIGLQDGSSGCNYMICPLNGVVNCSDANAGKFFSGLMDTIETLHSVIIAVTLFFVLVTKCSSKEPGLIFHLDGTVYFFLLVSYSSSKSNVFFISNITFLAEPKLFSLKTVQVVLT